jgi:hypothetical protein
MEEPLSSMNRTNFVQQTIAYRGLLLKDTSHMGPDCSGQSDHQATNGET